MIATRIKAMHQAQAGFNKTMLRPVLIEYTPNYFLIDHIPKLLAEGLSSHKQLNPNFTPDMSQLNPNFTPDMSQLNPNIIPG